MAMESGATGPELAGLRAIVKEHTGMPDKHADEYSWWWLDAKPKEVETLFYNRMTQKRMFDLGVMIYTIPRMTSAQAAAAERGILKAGVGLYHRYVYGRLRLSYRRRDEDRIWDWGSADG